MRSWKMCIAALAVSMAMFVEPVMAEKTTLQVLTYGGSHEENQEKAWYRPFEKKYNVEIKTMSPPMAKIAKIKAEHKAQNFTSDAIDLTAVGAINGCEQNYLEPIGHLVDKSDYLDGAVKECAIAYSMFSTNITVRPDQTEIRSPADFFNPEIPGKRGLPKRPRHVLEMALIGDGVPTDEVYDVLRTEEGVERAFEVMNRIKNRIIWWEASQQAPQLVMNGEVAATLAYNSRVTHYTRQGDAKGMKLVWDTAFMYSYSYYGVSSGAPNKEMAIELVKFITGPANNDFAKYSTYAPVRKEQPELSREFPTHPANIVNGVLDTGEFWATYGDSLEERFSSWRAN